MGAFRATDLVDIVFNLLHESGFDEVGSDLLTHVKSVHADIHACSFVDSSVTVEDVDSLEVVFLAEHVVVLVVSRSDLEATCAEFDFYVAVFDDRDYTTDKRHNHLLALKPLVLRVFRVDTHSCVAHDGLRTSRSNYCVTATLLIAVDYFFFRTCFA